MSLQKGKAMVSTVDSLRGNMVATEKQVCHGRSNFRMFQSFVTMALKVAQMSKYVMVSPTHWRIWQVGAPPKASKRESFVLFKTKPTNHDRCVHFSVGSPDRRSNPSGEMVNQRLQNTLQSQRTVGSRKEIKDCRRQHQQTQYPLSKRANKET